jgi:hypothetical protein
MRCGFGRRAAMLAMTLRARDTETMTPWAFSARQMPS